MTDEQGTNTAKEQRKKAPGVPFVKGDKRINRKGRPKSFDALRELAQQLANEKAMGQDKQPVVINGHVATQIEILLRTMILENPERFVEIGYGKVPTPIEIRDWREAARRDGVNPDEVVNDIERIIAAKMVGRGDSGSVGEGGRATTDAEVDAASSADVTAG